MVRLPDHSLHAGITMKILTLALILAATALAQGGTGTVTGDYSSLSSHDLQGDRGYSSARSTGDSAGNVVTPPTPLPDYAVGVGVSWNRGASYPLSVDTNIAVHLGTSNWYSWTTISTPVAATATGQPIPSTITTGGTYVAARSASGSVSLLLNFQGGFATVQPSGISPSFAGDIGMAIKPWTTRNLYILPYAKVQNASVGSSTGAFATAVFQPGILLFYGFGGK